MQSYGRAGKLARLYPNGTMPILIRNSPVTVEAQSLFHLNPGTVDCNQIGISKEERK